MEVVYAPRWTERSPDFDPDVVASASYTEKSGLLSEAPSSATGFQVSKPVAILLALTGVAGFAPPADMRSKVRTVLGDHPTNDVPRSSVVATGPGCAGVLVLVSVRTRIVRSARTDEQEILFAELGLGPEEDGEEVEAMV